MSAPKQAGRIYFFFSVAALVLGLYAAGDLRLLSDLPPSFSADADKVAYPARLGTTVVGSPAEARFLLQSRPIGSTVELRSDETTQRARLSPQLSRSELWIVVIEGLIFFAVNLLVFCPPVQRGAVRDFYWCTLLYGLAILVGGVYFPREPTLIRTILPLVWLACLAALPVFFLHMTLSFPRSRDLFIGRSKAIRVLAVIAGTLFLWQSIGYLRYFAHPGPAAWSAIQLPRFLFGCFLVACVGVGCFVLYQSSRTLELSRERDQTKWLLWGFTIGVTPYVFLRTLPSLIGIQSRVPSEVDRLFELAIPIAFTFAVVRSPFLKIDIIIRRSLIYGILAGLLAAVYFLVVSVVGHRLASWLPQYSAAITVISIAVPCLLFYPTRRLVGSWVDRTFFQVGYNFDQALAALEPSLRMASSQEAIAGITQSFLEDQLGLQSVAVIARERASLLVVGPWDTETATSDFAQLEKGLAGCRVVIPAPNSTSHPEIEAADFPVELHNLGVRILVPLRSDAALLGVILLGEKRSERRFVEEDLRLIDRVRAEAQTALERVELVQIASQEALEREKIQALEGFKSDFFARVAHDLRTPLTSIHWTVQNLLDGVGAPLDPAHASSLRTVLTSSNELSRLMDNLLDVSRLEDPKVAVKCEAVELNGIVREVTAALQPAAESRGVHFHVCPDPELDPVRGDRDKIHEIVANLLENAARYSPDGGEVEISLRRVNGRGQSLMVRDHGPGLSPQDLEVVFDRFQQGSPSPYSKQRGFGLGLYIVRSFAEMMGGSVEATNHPDGGACFVCTLPEWGKR